MPMIVKGKAGETLVINGAPVEFRRSYDLAFLEKAEIARYDASGRLLWQAPPIRETTT